MRDSDNFTMLDMMEKLGSIISVYEELYDKSKGVGEDVYRSIFFSLRDLHTMMRHMYMKENIEKH